MANRVFNPLDIFRQLEEELRQSTEVGSFGYPLFHPSLDMYETDDSLIIKVELAGVNPENIEVTLSADDSFLSISGERSESKLEHTEKLRCYNIEIFYGSFTREIVLPGNLRIDRENIRAVYKDGFLIATLPKCKQNASQKRSIQVTSEE